MRRKLVPLGQTKHSLVLFFILYYDEGMHNHFTNYQTPTCFDTIVCVIICEIIVHLLVIEQNN